MFEEHLTHGASNAQYTSKFSAVMLLETFDTWLERKQLTPLIAFLDVRNAVALYSGTSLLQPSESRMVD